MSGNERRYGHGEVRRIFENAAVPRPRQLDAVGASDGLTLAELQAIGREVGVSPAAVAEAAAALEASSPPASRGGLPGMPASVGLTVSLPRLPTDAEWELLLVELRETFATQGEERSRGNLREWTSYTQSAYVEPTGLTGEGGRLRLNVRKLGAFPLNLVGGASIAIGLIALATLALTNDLTAGNALLPAGWGIIGSAALGFNLLRLPRWARSQETHMVRIAERARTMLSDPPRSTFSPAADAGAPSAPDP